MSDYIKHQHEHYVNGSHFTYKVVDFTYKVDECIRLPIVPYMFQPQEPSSVLHTISKRHTFQMLISINPDQMSLSHLLGIC